MMSASVVIPAFNAAATIGDTLRALVNQARAPAETEIFVVDNGSRDETAEVVRRFPQVALLHESTPGPAAARNCGLRHASKGIIVHLDADTLPARTWLQKLVAPFSNPMVVLVAGRTLVFNPSTPVERYIAGAGVYDTDRAVTRLPFPFAPSLNMAVRRDAALAVGGWAEELLTAEDVDFSHRIVKQYNAEITYARDAVLFHRVRSTKEQLAALARSYGRGVAQMYLRYPDQIRWDFVKTAKTNTRIAIRRLESGILRIGQALALTPRAKVEFSQCHVVWSQNFASGFYDVYYRSRHEDEPR